MTEIINNEFHFKMTRDQILSLKQHHHEIYALLQSLSGANNKSGDYCETLDIEKLKTEMDNGYFNLGEIVSKEYLINHVKESYEVTDVFGPDVLDDILLWRTPSELFSEEALIEEALEIGLSNIFDTSDVERIWDVDDIYDKDDVSKAWEIDDIFNAGDVISAWDILEIYDEDQIIKATEEIIAKRELKSAL